MTINEAQDEIMAKFLRLPDWIEKCEYLIESGKTIAVYDIEFQNAEYALRGCQSQVWICPVIKDGYLSFLADSDSAIIKGVIFLLLKVLNNRLPGEIAKADLYFVKEIGLSTNLSPTRANGVASIIKQMKHLGELLDR